MTDSHSSSPHSPQPQPSATHQSGHSYEGFDPEFPEEQEAADKRAARVNTVQVGASAAAAVTSAVVASFFGVAGTLIGAAVGSIVSTVAGALYADYARKAGRRLRDTRAVVVQRLPTEALTSTPLRHLTGPVTASTHSAANAPTTRNPADPANPAAVPGRASLQPVTQDGQETVAAPLVTPEEIQQASTSFDPTTVISGQHLSETQLIPRITAETITQPAVTGAPTSANGTNVRSATTGGPNAGSGEGAAPGPNGHAPSTTARRPDPRPWWKRPPVLLSGLGVLCFLLAIGVVTGIELVIRHPLSDSHVSGTSLSRSVEGKGTSSKPTPTVTVTVTPSASATQPATATATPAAPATGAPTSTSTGAPTGQPTGTTQATSTQGALAPGASSTP